MSVRKLQDISAEHISQAGGKAASLGELHRAGHPVPAGFVISADENELTPQLLADILAAYDELALGNVAVRSSGVGEDGKTQSWAGQFATLLHVNRDRLADAVRACWESANAVRVAAYSGDGVCDLAVLIQQMIYSETSGVAFSANPVTGNRGEVMVEAVYGLGELLVQGLATPDNYVIDKQSGDILAEDIAVKTRLLTYVNGHTAELDVDPELQRLPALTPSQLQELTTMVTSIETHYGFAVDVEWAYQNGQLYLLQARPITTL